MQPLTDSLAYAILAGILSVFPGAVALIVLMGLSSPAATAAMTLQVVLSVSGFLAVTLGPFYGFLIWYFKRRYSR